MKKYLPTLSRLAQWVQEAPREDFKHGAIRVSIVRSDDVVRFNSQEVAIALWRVGYSVGPIMAAAINTWAPHDDRSSKLRFALTKALWGTPVLYVRDSEEPDFLSGNLGRLREEFLAQNPGFVPPVKPVPVISSPPPDSVSLASNENTPPDILARLAASKDPRVRQAVVRNPPTPEAALARLRVSNPKSVLSPEDPDTETRILALGKPLSRFTPYDLPDSDVI